MRVTFPAALPSIATGIRVSAAAALQVGVTAEFLIGSDGIGAYMQSQQLAFNIPELYAAIVLVGMVGYAIHVTLRIAGRYLRTRRTMPNGDVGGARHADMARASQPVVRAGNGARPCTGGGRAPPARPSVSGANHPFRMTTARPP